MGRDRKCLYAKWFPREKKRGEESGSSNQVVAASQAKGVRAYLEVVCKSHCMVSALIQL